MEILDIPIMQSAMAYYKMKDELMLTHKGRWVAFHDSEFIGDYDSYDDARDAMNKHGFNWLDCFITCVGLISIPSVFSVSKDLKQRFIDHNSD